MRLRVWPKELTEEAFVHSETTVQAVFVLESNRVTG